jgi:hypothetical protein
MNTQRIHLVLLPVSCALLVFLAFSWFVNAQAGGILYVAEDGDCGGWTPCYETLQEAVDAASEGNEIRVAAGIYPLQAGNDQVVLVEKSLTIRGGFTTSNWTTPDPETNPTIMNALGQGRAMVISGAIEVTVEGLRMTYGNAEGLGGSSDGDDAGGALYINGTDVTLRESWIMTSTTPADGVGGGLYVLSSPTGFVMEDCLVQGNYAKTGGGVYLYAITSTLTNNIIQNNTGDDWGKGAGTRIYSGYTTLSDNLISHNKGGAGAGLAISGGVTLMDRNTIEYNQTWSSGGGINLDGLWQDPGNLHLVNNLIQNNSSQSGGGIYVSGSNLTMLRNTILNNDAKRSGGMYGGGLNLDSGADKIILIYDNLFEGNRATYGGAIYNRAASPTIIESNSFLGNQATDAYFSAYGGALNIEASDGQILRNVFLGNSANQGGNPYSESYGGAMAIYNDNIISNNIVVDNSVSGSSPHAPGVYINGCTPELYHNTISNNTGAEGSGVYVRQAGDDGEPGRPVLYNTVIVSQTVGVFVSDASSQNLATLYGALWWNNGSNYEGTVFAFDEVTGDPLFVDPANDDYHILDGSAAIDASPDDWLNVDFDFEPRYGISDLGADEYWAPGALKRMFIPLVAKE